MLEEELFSLFKGNTSAAAGVGRVGGGRVWLYSYHRNIHLVPATTTTTTLLQLRGLSNRYWQLKQEF